MAVIGIGFGQHVHIPAFRADPRSRVAAVCASTEERARKVADRLEIENAFGNWREACARPDVDAVSISVPAALQPEIVRLAARHGKHVFCEKPLATTEEGARSALESAVSADVVHAMDFEFRAIPQWRRAREICRSGAVLGRLRQIAVTWRVET
ncbi:MAG TPA: Gfo/Idh/MocA family oxidoreductase, partial [Polyangia bacterium]|nr:Gfo/Idh/MocA family oxidoreductase [Polyangia bacterium]